MIKVGIALAVAALLYASAAGAQGTPSLRLNGFGTVGVVHSNEDQADFVANLLASEGAGYTSEWSAKVDSRLGLQLTADLTPRLSSVVQIITEQGYDGAFKPSVEWANIRFDITPDLSVRAGRTLLPNFMVSEFRKVGYTNPWVRPPQEVYSLVPISNSDGVDLSYVFRSHGFINSLQIVYGRKDFKLDAKLPGGTGGEMEVRDGFTVANTLERGAATFFVSHGSYHLTLDAFDPLFDGFRAFGPDGEAIAERYDIDNKRYRTLSIGARYDPGDWFVMSEWARIRSRTLLSDSRGWYISGGYRFESITPYLTLGERQVTGNTSDPGLSAPQAQGLNNALNALLGLAAEQKSIAVGVRWDVVRNAALKLQFDHLDLGAESKGMLANEQPNFRRGGRVSLFSATLDFVF
jgi:hypothetical protein